MTPGVNHQIRKVFLIVFSCVLSILLVSGTPTSESFRFGLVCGVISSSGAYIWKSIYHIRQVPLYESIGMGIAIGSASASISQLAFRSTVLNPFSWLIPAVIVFACSRFSATRDRQPAESDPSYTNNSATLLLDLVLFASLALAQWWWWIYPFCLALFISTYLNRKISDKKPFSVNKFRIIQIVSIGIGFFISIQLSMTNSVWKIVSYDQIFSESLSVSLNMFGPTDSPFLSDTPTKYHWFALHFSGLISNAANGESFTSITRVIPILSYIGIFCLLAALTKRTSITTNHHLFSAGILLLGSNVMGFSFSRFLVSPTFQFSCVWMMGLALVALKVFEKPSVSNLILFGFLSFATLGGKLMNGAIVLGAVGLIFLITYKGHLLRSITVIATICASTGIAYIYFFSSPYDSHNNLRIGLSAAIDFGIINSGSTTLAEIAGLLVLQLAILGPLYVVVLLPSPDIQNDFSLTALFKVTAILGIVCTSLTSHEGASQLYFAMAALVFASVALPLVAFESFVLSRNSKMVIAIAVISGFGSVQFWKSASDTGDYRTSFLLRLISVLLAPLLAFIFWLCQNLQTDRSDASHRSLIKIAGVVVVVSTLFIGVHQRIEFASDLSNFSQTDPMNPNNIGGSADLVSTLIWLRANSKESDVIATNRFCIPEVDPCIMKWQMVSALSHRRLLIEGGYLTPDRLSGESLLRYKMSNQFGTSPNLLSLKYLCDKNVRYYLFNKFDMNVAPDWFDFAKIIKVTKNAELVELNCSTTLL